MNLSSQHFHHTALFLGKDISVKVQQITDVPVFFVVADDLFTELDEPDDTRLTAPDEERLTEPEDERLTEPEV